MHRGILPCWPSHAALRAPIRLQHLSVPGSRPAPVPEPVLGTAALPEERLCRCCRSDAGTALSTLLPAIWPSPADPDLAAGTGALNPPSQQTQQTPTAHCHHHHLRSLRSRTGGEALGPFCCHGLVFIAPQLAEAAWGWPRCLPSSLQQTPLHTQLLH